MAVDFSNLKSDISNISKTIRFVYESDKRLCYVRLVLIAVQSILPLASLYLLKKLIDTVTHANINNPEGFTEVSVTIAIVSAVFLLIQVSTAINNYVGEILGQRIIDFINTMLHNKSLELDLTYYDNAEYHDTFHRAQQEANFRPIQILSNISDLIKNFISFVGTAIILASLSWWILIIMILAGIPSLIIRMRKSRIYYAWKKANTSLYRRVNYFSMLMTHRTYAKEVRIFNLGKYLQNTHNSIRGKLMDQIIVLLRTQMRGNVLSAVVEIGALTASIVILTNKFYTGSVSIGGYVMFFAAVRSANTFLNGVVSNVNGIYNNKLFLSNLFEFIDLKPQIRVPENPIPMPVLKDGIRFENVSFHYEGSSKMVLNNLSFHIKPGETVLITGKNGAGKTTLINILTRMYECTSGAVTFDNINIKDIDPETMHKNIGIIFQDYSKYDMTVTENIKFGNVFEDHDPTKVAEISGASVFVKDLPLQYNTLIGKYFQDGEELSIGQWQKIALARALYNSQSQIVILDEPTASIDLETENHFFENLRETVKDKIVIIIGHKITGKIKADSYYNLQKGTLIKVDKDYSKA